MDCTNIIGEKIKSLRSTQEISIQELAERAGLTVEQVSRIEENIDIPSLAPLIKIARVLGYDWVLSWTTSPMRQDR